MGACGRPTIEALEQGFLRHRLYVFQSGCSFCFPILGVQTPASMAALLSVLNPMGDPTLKNGYPVWFSRMNTGSQYRVSEECFCK
jgi:hypothetical protein